MPGKDNFFSLLQQGKKKPSDIDDYVDRWHDMMGGGQTLHAFLGMSWKMYCDWLDEGSDYLKRFYGTRRGPCKTDEKRLS